MEMLGVFSTGFWDVPNRKHRNTQAAGYVHEYTWEIGSDFVKNYGGFTHRVRIKQ